MWWSCYSEQIGSYSVVKNKMSRTFLSCYFKVFKHGTMDLLEHLYPVNNMIRLKLNANLPAVKTLIQTASDSDFEDVKVITANKILK